MRFFTALALLASSALTAALPTPSDVESTTDDIVNSPIYKAYEDAFSTGNSISERQSTMRNDLIDGKCGGFIVIFARGTTDVENTGSLGPPFFDAIEKVKPGESIVQGVNDYPADVIGYLIGGSRTGAKYMASMVSLAASQCPDSKVVLSGYSQGAQVTHLAADLIPVSLYSKVAAIVLFGDPYNGDVFPGSLNSNVKTFCNDGDLICDGLPIVLSPHLAYAQSVDDAAAFVAARV